MGQNQVKNLLPRSPEKTLRKSVIATPTPMKNFDIESQNSPSPEKKVK